MDIQVVVHIFGFIKDLFKAFDRVRKVYFTRQDKIAIETKTGFLVKESIKALRDEVLADRVYVLQFKNGGEFYGGKPEQKVRKTFDEPTRGTLPDMYFHTEVPVTLVLSMVDDTIHGLFRYQSVEDIPDMVVRALHKHRSVKSVVGAPLYKRVGSKHVLVGLIYLEWINNTAPDLHKMYETGGDSQMLFSRLLESISGIGELL